MRYLVLFLLICISTTHFAQQTFSFKIVDHATGEPIPGARISIDSLKIGAIADAGGIAVIKAIPMGEHRITIQSIGYDDLQLVMLFPTRQQEPRLIELTANTELDEIIVEGTRSNKSISDSPTRTEVLTDEIDEAASMEPGKVSHLLTHTTGIQVQTTSAGSNGSVIRVQGLNGRYTQLLKDGFPMYGGFSGSLDIMQIPPLDLKQVEFVKGPASTLYGGGAIAGIVNLISKTPATEETLLHINYSTIGARDFNAYVSRNPGKFGFTNLASFHAHLAYDPDGDGFSDLAQVTKFNFNPRLFYTPSKKLEFYFGVNISKDTRVGGDMNRINHEPVSYVDFYLDEQESQRYSSQFKTSFSFTEKSKLTLRNSISLFSRYISIQENLAENTRFKGEQLNTFSELNYMFKSKKHTLVTGANFVTDQFTESPFTTDTARSQWYQTLGGFANHVFDITEKISLESGLRADYVLAGSKQNTSGGQFFLLPRISSLFKVTKGLALRLGGGMGYRMPTIFNEEAEPIAYKNIRPIDFAATKAEQSMGGNFDIKYTTNFGTENLLLSVNQMFFYNVIDNPIFLVQNGTGELAYQNFGKRVHSRGFETQLKFTFWKITWFLGYTFNEAFLETDAYNAWLTLTPQHSIKGDFLFVSENKWRIGLDYEYKSKQWLSTGLSTPALFTSGLVIERTLGNFVLFFNAENYTDVRQTRYQNLISAPNNTPQQTEIWAPLDGRFFNGGVKIKL
ncbi:MAG: TonB-dependent receptor plug domain-containing protein [Bacteroidetes bacterium]|nr:TonB-dependent receptor plug domain-containing protein [Bacteroidota bacterium]